jgi:hypothetical protein
MARTFRLECNASVLIVQSLSRQAAEVFGNSGHENDTPILLHSSCVPLRHHFADDPGG